MLNADSLAQLAALKSQIKVEKNLLQGVVRGTSNRFGFVECPTGESYFIPPEEMKRVFPGDRVEFTLADVDGKSQAVLENLLATTLSGVMGKVIRKGPNSLLNTEHPGMNRWISLASKSAESIAEDTWVKCQITRHPFPDGKAVAKVLNVVAQGDDPLVEHTVGKARFDLSAEFSESVDTAAQALDYTAIMAAQTDYIDDTQRPYFTIDAASTQDMDDALSIEDLGHAWRLHVAIADPSLFVQPGSTLDREALQRGTSRYLPAETLHMLPKALSVTACSLQPAQRRPALLFKVDVAKGSGQAGTPQFAFGFVISQAKLAYTEVSALLAGANDVELAPSIHHQLQLLEQLTTDLTHLRQQQALVMEERPDYRYDLDEVGHIAAIREEPRTRAHQMVEECMLLTNRLTAEHLAQHNVGLFLCHEGFRDDQETTLLPLFEQSLGVVPEDLNNFEQMLPLLQEAQRHPELPLARMLAKSYQRTALLSEPRPHWGLGFRCYTTVTSPIRKYLDLVLHRQLKALWRGEAVPTLTEAELQHLQETQSSSRQLSNYVETWLKTLYMKTLEGQKLTGEIQHTIPSGFSVQLDKLGISGFVNVKGWRDKSAQYDPILQTHRSERGDFGLGARVQVEVHSVDLERRNVQLNVVGLM
ncbi:VacB/RNase II family 3'-5' exoribonuclease [Salinispirillum marinum]|uniref:exoribonuclease II n=2 Tax=Saccharospirillaceae TaxID=255527 RepID=A0ABV8BEV8_9GAMM